MIADYRSIGLQLTGEMGFMSEGEMGFMSEFNSYELSSEE
jgi:hypothetical protein